VSSAVIMTILTALAVWRFLRGESGGREASPGADPPRGEDAAPLGIAGP